MNTHVKLDVKLHELDEIEGYALIDEKTDNRLKHIFGLPDTPELIYYNSNKNLYRVLKYENNILHISFIKITGKTTLLYHREEDLPAVLCLNSNLQYTLSQMRYYKMGQLHRDENLGPAEIYLAYDGEINFLIYRKNGLKHREGKPAVIHHDGSYSYFKENHLHRLEGPAIKDGKLFSWFVNGTLIDKNKFPIFKRNKIINKIKITRKLLIEAMFFDRDYGKFLNDKFQSLSSSSLS